MKDWVKKAGGVLFAALLTVMLNGKAYAEDEAQPQDVTVEIPEPAPAMTAGANGLPVIRSQLRAIEFFRRYFQVQYPFDPVKYLFIHILYPRRRFRL